MTYTTAIINLQTIKARCEIDKDGCWIWAMGTIGNKRPYWATRGEHGKRINVFVPRAVAELTGREVPRGHHIKPMCGKTMCVHPECLHLPKPASGMFSQLLGYGGRSVAHKAS